ncbi:MAG: TIGR03936 family radical SAM-associated protein [Clostridiales Family XIII bacterium]|jgi:radical SAM-linked protein|nr:TIGR03936 family radical SAM-associated protein [Clostridiales Family XIII bacterium]
MKYVIEFSKTGRCAYISHLDLARALLRALRMTGLRPAYSQGFNPHPKMSIALPLSLGQSSVCELIEIEIGEGQTGANAANALNDRLPDGIRVLSVREKPAAYPKPLASYVKAAEYEILCDGIFDANERLAAFFECKQVLIQKTSKKTGQTVEKDIRPDMLSYTVKKELKGWLLCRVTLRAEGGAVLSPRTFFDAFVRNCHSRTDCHSGADCHSREGGNLYVPSITRTAILGDGGAVLSGTPR